MKSKQSYTKGFRVAVSSLILGAGFLIHFIIQQQRTYDGKIKKIDNRFKKLKKAWKIFIITTGVNCFLLYVVMVIMSTLYGWSTIAPKNIKSVFFLVKHGSFFYLLPNLAVNLPMVRN